MGQYVARSFVYNFDSTEYANNVSLVANGVAKLHPIQRERRCFVAYKHSALDPVS
jgi:hypothetical protein